jgi:protein O-mannosyl-transferase
VKRQPDRQSNSSASGALSAGESRAVDDEQVKDHSKSCSSQPAGVSAVAAGRPASGSTEGLRASWARGWLAGFCLLAATFLAYQPVWHAGFIWDDDSMLTENPLIKRADGLYRFWCSTQSPDYFPATSTTLWLEWRLWGNHPLGYHLTNVLLHALSAVVWWRVLVRLQIPGALLAAALFALHPVNVESVAWITERKNTLAMFFHALTLLWYLRFEDTGRRRWYWLGLGAFGLALLSKTAVVMLPVVLLGTAWWRRGRVDLREVRRSLPFFAMSVLLGLVTVWFQYHQAIGTDVVRTDSFWSRLAGAGWAVWFYLYKAVWPLQLIFVYPQWQIDAANVLSYVPGLLVVAGLGMCWGRGGGWGRALFFGLGYFVVMLLPVLGFLNIYFMRFSLVANHWQYFSIIGPLALAAAALTAGLGGLAQRQRLVKPALAGILLLVLGVLTWRQSGIYADSETLWRTTVSQNANSWTAHHNLGNALVTKGRDDEAIAHFQKALEIQPDFAMAHNNLGNALLAKGQTDEAIAHFQKALEIQPDDATAHNNLGNVLLQSGRADDAIHHFEKALAARPDYAWAHYNLGNALLARGRRDEAVAHFQKALEIKPDLVEAQINLGNVLFLKGQVNEAIAHFRSALELRPDHAEGHNNLGYALVRIGQVREAMAHYQMALKIQPDYADPCNNLAWVLATCPEASIRNGARALELAQQANRLSGGQNPIIIKTLAAAYAEAGRFPEAVTATKRAIELATAAGNTTLVNDLRAQIELYQAGSPFRDTIQRNDTVQPKRP